MQDQNIRNRLSQIKNLIKNGNQNTYQSQQGQILQQQEIESLKMQLQMSEQKSDEKFHEMRDKQLLND